MGSDTLEIRTNSSKVRFIMYRATDVINLFEKQERLKAGIRTKINKEIIKFTSGIYFKKIPLQDIFDICEKYNVVLLQEDNTKWSGMLVGNASTVIFGMASKDSGYPSGQGSTMYVPYVNAGLNLQWYKMQSGKYEITLYVS
jgi:hypothetical protein